MKLTKIAAVASIALFSSSLALAQPQTYKPGVGVAIDSLGMLNVGYKFGADNMNLVSFSTGYTKVTAADVASKRGSLLNMDGHLMPVVLSYARYFKIAPEKFDNKLFWNVQPFYGKEFGSFKDDNGDSFKDKTWFAGVNVGLEYRLTSQLAIGGGLQAFSHTEVKSDEPNTQAVKVNEVFAKSAVYIAYQF
jgi:hypothetical protein